MVSRWGVGEKWRNASSLSGGEGEGTLDSNTGASELVEPEVEAWPCATDGNA